MSFILACPPAELREPWSAWLIPGGSSSRSDGPGPTDAQPLEGLPEQWPAADEYLVVVRAAMLSWQRVTLPRLPRQRWQQALTGLLEDQLLSEAEQLHLALGPETQAGRPTWVAVCNKAWLKSALDLMETAGLHVRRVVPEFEPGAPGLYLTGPPNQVQMVQVDDQGVLALPLDKLAREALQSWAPMLTDDSAVPLWAEPALAGLAQDVMHRPAQLMSTAQRLWRASQSNWNLVQFDLAADQGRHRLQRSWAQTWLSARWRPVRWGLLALLTIQLLGLLTWAWQASGRQKSRQGELEALVRNNFPQIRLIVDPVQQMRREVQALALASGSADPGDLGVMLSVLADAGVPPIKRMDYSAGQLDLKEWALPAARAQALKLELASRGYLLQGQGQQWQMKVRSP